MYLEFLKKKKLYRPFLLCFYLKESSNPTCKIASSTAKTHIESKIMSPSI